LLAAPGFDRKRLPPAAFLAGDEDWDYDASVNPAEADDPQFGRSELPDIGIALGCNDFMRALLLQFQL